MGTTLSSLPNTLFAFKKGINVARSEKGALFPKGTVCSCLFPLPKKQPASSLGCSNLSSQSKTSKPSCMHLLGTWEKKGGLGKNRGGRRHGRRRSLDLPPKASQQTPLQSPLPQEENLATSCMHIPWVLERWYDPGKVKFGFWRKKCIYPVLQQQS